MQLLFRLVHPLPILTVHDEHETLRSSVVVSPQRSNLVLPSNIPHVELDVLICHRLDVETDCPKLERKPEFDMYHEANAPVGIVVTDWFNLSLYKIAANATSEHADPG